MSNFKASAILIPLALVLAPQVRPQEKAEQGIPGQLKPPEAELKEKVEQGVMDSMSSEHMGMDPHMKLTAPRPQTPEDLKRAEQIVGVLRESIAKYKDYQAALTEGYKIFLPQIPKPIYHFTNYRYGVEAAFKFDPSRPTSLLYRKTASGYELIGAMYTAPGALSENDLHQRVPLSVARWHQHVNICSPPSGQGLKADWTKFGPKGSITTEEECTAAGGRFLRQIFGWMVHVYPFETTPEKIWSH